MSVRPNSHPPNVLVGSEGELVAVRLCVEPRLLEDLLEALAEVGFPINPQIHHLAGVAYLDRDGKRESTCGTLVEFPAYRSRVDEVRHALERYGLPVDSLEVRSMLAELQSALVGD
jgi:hypothetical protein